MVVDFFFPEDFGEMKLLFVRSDSPFKFPMLSRASLFPPWSFKHGLFESCSELYGFSMAFWIVLIL